MHIIDVAGRVIRQLVKDKRTLMLLFVAPLFVIFLLYTVLNSAAGRPRVEAIGLPDDLKTAIAEQADVTVAANLGDALDTLQSRQTDAVVTLAGSTVTAHVEGSQTAVTASVKKALATAIGNYTKSRALGAAGQQMQERPGLSFTDVTYAYLNGSDSMTTFDSISALLMGFFIFFFVFIIAGIAFLRERISGTLERLLATPVRRYEIVFGYFLGFGVFVLMQTLLIQLFMVYALSIALKGNFLLVLLTNILLAAVSLSLGTLLSAFARNELQLFQFIPIVIVPQIIFCGMFSLRGAPGWVIVLSKVFPLTYAADALENVAFRGLGFAVIAPDLLILFGYMALFLLLNTLALKKYRRI